MRHIAHKQVNVESEVADTSTSNEGKLQKDQSLEMENVETGNIMVVVPIELFIILYPNFVK